MGSIRIAEFYTVSLRGKEMQSCAAETLSYFVMAIVEDIRGIDAPFYVASTGDAEAFGKQLSEEMQSMGMDGRELAQITADGAAWIWNLADIYYPDAAPLLDFYHAAEHLHQTAAALWPKETADAWCKERLHQLKTGDLDGFFTELRRTAEEEPSTKEPAHDPKRLLNYFETNRERLRYTDAVKNKLPIGSGTVESAAKTYCSATAETIRYALVASRRAGSLKLTYSSSKRSVRAVLGKLCRRLITFMAHIPLNRKPILCCQAPAVLLSYQRKTVFEKNLTVKTGKKWRGSRQGRNVCFQF